MIAPSIYSGYNPTLFNYYYSGFRGTLSPSNDLSNKNTNFNYSLFKNAYISDNSNNYFKSSPSSNYYEGIIIPVNGSLIVPEFAKAVHAIPYSILHLQFDLYIDYTNIKLDDYTEDMLLEWLEDKLQAKNTKLLLWQLGNNLKYYIYYDSKSKTFSGYVNNNLLFSNETFRYTFIISDSVSECVIDTNVVQVKRTTMKIQNIFIFADKFEYYKCEYNLEWRINGILYPFLTHTDDGDLKIYNIFKTNNGIYELELKSTGDFVNYFYLPSDISELEETYNTLYNSSSYNFIDNQSITEINDSKRIITKVNYKSINNIKSFIF